MFTFKDFMAVLESFLESFLEEDADMDSENMENDEVSEAFDSVWEGR